MKRIFTACIGLCLCVATVMAQDRMSRGQSALTGRLRGSRYTMGSGGSGGQIISKPGQTEDCQGQQLQFLSVYGAERAPGRALRRGRECFFEIERAESARPERV